MSLLLLIALLVSCAVAIAPPGSAASGAPPLPSNSTSLGGNPINPLPPPQCYSGAQVFTKPALRAQNCEPIFDWFQRKGIFERVPLTQENPREIHTFPPPDAGVFHNGCEIEVYSRVVPARITLSLSDIQQAAKHIIDECKHVRLGGRGGKSAILSPPRGIVPGWFVKVEAKVSVVGQE